MTRLQMFGALLIGSMSVLVGLAGRVLVPGFPDTLLVVTSFSIVPWMIHEFIRRAMYTRSDSKSAFQNGVVAYGLQLVSVVVLLSADQMTSELAIAALGMSSLVAVAFGFYQFRGSIQTWPSKQTVVKTWIDSWNMGRWLVASDIARWFGTNGHGWLVAGVLGAEALGMYRAVLLVLNLLNPIRQTVMNYFPPRASRSYKAEGRVGLNRWVKRTFAVCTLPSLVIITPMVIFPESVLRLAYAGKFTSADAQWVLVWAAIAQWIGTTRMPLDMAMLAMGRPRGLFLTNVVAMVFLLTVGLLFVYTMGIKGVVLSQVGLGLATLIVSGLLYVKAVSVDTM